MVRQPVAANFENQITPNRRITMAQLEIADEIRQLELEIDERRKKLAELTQQSTENLFGEFTFHDHEGGELTLGNLFGASDELLVVHNMGKSCSYCTLWADGFNGVVQHLNDRAPFVVISPDPPEVQREFAQGRGWQFQMVSDPGAEFAKATGYWNFEHDRPNPGVSAFRKVDNGSYERTGTSMLGPGDLFCGVWHLFDLLPNGRNDWNPKFDY
jgi:predicted dithiol-disulfide oxidoreductase (DUF899 family)